MSILTNSDSSNDDDDDNRRHDGSAPRGLHHDANGQQ